MSVSFRKVISIISFATGYKRLEYDACERYRTKSLLPLAKGEKVADRPDEGVVCCFCRSEILHGVAFRPGSAHPSSSSGSTSI
jgi:hypothetical protein